MVVTAPRRSRWLNSFALQILAPGALALVVLLGVSLTLHSYILRDAGERGAAEVAVSRIYSTVRQIASLPPDERAGAARRNSTPDMKVEWSARTAVPDGSDLDDDLRAIVSGPPEWQAVRVRLDASGTSGNVQDVAISVQLPDSTWVNARLRAVSLLSADDVAFRIAIILTAGTLLALAAFASRLIAKPLALLATRARNLPADGVLKLDGLASPTEVRDVAEALEAATSRTRELLQQRSLALGALSHDLLSPLARMRLRAEDIADDHARGRMLQDVREMAEMVTDVLAYLRGGDGGGEAATRISLVSLVQVVVDECAEEGALLEERAYEDSTVLAQPTALKRAIRNVLGNAVKYGRSPWVEVLRRGNEAIVAVGDSGPGVAPGDLERVFEPFFRGDEARAAGEGSGLGLPTAKAITESHGGRLEMQSVQGIGTIVKLTLPSARAA
ncbi:sensor histidine kinase [Pseudoroseomonas ludipueritiae]|uniref:histidine kinase n=1 Tax=Pseudoroseomonas ludipueritiae TaxID=198093 RepID=A0ABR7R2H6_9PROT|nr:HAMP domain-containing sensor histidine kinase [Pseudoroseomonas ludipueritiae]MBC9175938.1 HAMP domain-containing histidine kinase [Pseudoroseomonas ludipueritiae]